jgi:hypothetical protein
VVPEVAVPLSPDPLGVTPLVLLAVVSARSWTS